jgi:hypothetical protein
MNIRLKQSLVVLGFVGCSLGILWSLNIHPTSRNDESNLLGDSDEGEELSNTHYQFPATSIHETAEGKAAFNSDYIRQKIDSALGLSVATISVSMVHPPASERAIPWREDRQPVVKLSLPSSWLSTRSEQLGGEDAVLHVLRSTILSVIPGSKIQFQIVQVPQTLLAVQPVTESYAKQIAIAVGLIAVLLSGCMIDRRRPQQETIVVRQVDHPSAEATRILQLEHSSAKTAIDALSGSYKVSVLRHIINTELNPDETPIVHIQRQEETELINSN